MLLGEQYWRLGGYLGHALVPLSWPDAGLLVREAEYDAKEPEIAEELEETRLKFGVDGHAFDEDAYDRYEDAQVSRGA